MVLRGDLSLGAALAQCTHAAGESSRLAPELPDNTHAVVLRAEDEQALLRLDAELTARGIVHVCVREPDEPYCGQMTAIGVKPCLRESTLKRIMRGFPLFK